MGRPSVMRNQIRAALPGTPDQIAVKIGCSVGYVRETLLGLGREGLAHVKNARGEPGFPFSQNWAEGPPGPNSPAQPDFGQKRDKSYKPKEPAGPPSKQVTEETIKKARDNPASWLSVLG